MSDSASLSMSSFSLRGALPALSGAEARRSREGAVRRPPSLPAEEGGLAADRAGDRAALGVCAGRSRSPASECCTTAGKGGSATASVPALRCDDDGRRDASDARARARSSRSCCGETLTDLRNRGPAMSMLMTTSRRPADCRSCSRPQAIIQQPEASVRSHLQGANHMPADAG